MSKPRQPSKSQYEMLAAFRYALRCFIRFSEQAALAAGISGQQYQALLAIKGFPGTEKVTMGQLAERLQLRPHSAVGLVDRLAALELVARTAALRDRRQVLVHLTDRGERMLEKLASVHREQLKQIGPEIATLLKRLGQAEE